MHFAAQLERSPFCVTTWNKKAGVLRQAQDKFRWMKAPNKNESGSFKHSGFIIGNENSGDD